VIVLSKVYSITQSEENKSSAQRWIKWKKNKQTKKRSKNPKNLISNRKKKVKKTRASPLSLFWGKLLQKKEQNKHKTHP